MVPVAVLVMHERGRRSVLALLRTPVLPLLSLLSAVVVGIGVFDVGVFDVGVLELGVFARRKGDLSGLAFGDGEGSTAPSPSPVLSLLLLLSSWQTRDMKDLRTAKLCELVGGGERGGGGHRMKVLGLQGAHPIHTHYQYKVSFAFVLPLYFLLKVTKVHTPCNSNQAGSRIEVRIT